MELYLALDILDGQCVRLRRGNFEKKTVYSKEPKTIVRWIQLSGAKHLHLVDLNGARDPKQRQYSLMKDLVANSNLSIQYGGGIRSHRDIEEMLKLGANRVVIGSLSITDPALTLSLLKEFGPDQITLALDIRTKSDGSIYIATEGWSKTSDQNIFECIQFYLKGGLKRILCTDIRRDGMMKGPNFPLYQELLKHFPEIEIQASGGVSSIEDLQTLKKNGVHSAIIGKALYEGSIPIQKALLLC